MRIEKIIEQLETMKEGDDSEIYHGVADELLLDLLVQLGRDDVVAAYRRARKRVVFWYA